MGTYVVGDIHGRFKEWIEFKNRIEQQDSNATFILIGDIVDRGPETIEMLNWAMNNISENGKYQMVLGNHEHLKIQWYHKYYLLDKQNIEYTYKRPIRPSDLYNISIDNYGYSILYTDRENGIEELEHSIEWFETLPLHKDITINNQRFIIVHAYMPSEAINESDYTIKKKEELDEDTIKNIVWERDKFKFDTISNAILIHGHTPTTSVTHFISLGLTGLQPGKIYKSHNVYNVDCGLTFREIRPAANLAMLQLDNLQEHYLY